MNANELGSGYANTSKATNRLFNQYLPLSTFVNLFGNQTTFLKKCFVPTKSSYASIE